MNQNKSNIRVRFAPSPTGPLHIGGVRTALYNFLFARKYGGKFILRIEDTDQKRFVEGAEDYISEALNWCGLEPDEGPSQGGDYGPYRQSERQGTYWQFVKRLLDSGDAYYAFDTPEELDEMRKKMKDSGISAPTYNSITRSSMKNSLSLALDDVQKKIDGGEKYVIRIKMPRNHEVKFEDEIRGWVSVNTNNIDDKVLFKSDGMPTYHLANVVDDFQMKISHVIRGEEWLPSAPLHVYLYQVFNWADSMPIFAHLPLILKPEGNGKLSKRDGDRLGFPVFPIDWHSLENNQVFSGYKEKGFLQEAFINMLAFLGWNPGTEQEIFTIEQLIQAFSIDRVGKSGSKYDYAKTKWFNQQHLRLLSDEAILNSLLIESDSILTLFPKEYNLKVISLVKERAVFIKDILIEASCFFCEEVDYSEKAINKKWNKDLYSEILDLNNILFDLVEFNEGSIELAFKSYIESRGLLFGKIMPMLRIAVTGNMAGPSLFAILELLGKDKMKKRVLVAIENII